MTVAVAAAGAAFTTINDSSGNSSEHAFSIIRHNTFMTLGYLACHCHRVRSV